MRDYYEILEVHPKASNETINKVYRMLVKKYHPDTKEGLEKAEAEEKIKLINEAYDVLSDESKRSEYDSLLNSSADSNEDLAKKYEELYNENQILRVQLQNYKDTFDRINNIAYYENNYNNNYNNNYDNNNNDDYDNSNARYTTQNAYRKKYYYTPNTNIYHKSFIDRVKEKLQAFFAIVVTCFVFVFAFWIFWAVPFTHDWMKDNPFFVLLAKIFGF